MTRRTKLELVWPGKEDRPRLEPRILIEDPAMSYHAAARCGATDRFDNLLVKGDNLLALKALETKYAGKIKCVFIDPPYNTGSAFEHYDDGLEHSLWLSMMRERVELLRRLLSDDGSMWVTLDDNEAHYFKVMCDEVFGRGNFVANVVWQKKYAPANDAIWLSDNHDHLLVFAKNKGVWRPRALPRSEQSNKAYKNQDDDERGAWKTGDYTCNKSSTERPNLYYPITNPHTGQEVWPKETAVWRFNPETHARNVEERRVWWGKKGANSVPAYKRFLTDVEDDGTVPQTIWLWSDVGHNQDGKKEQQQLFPNNPFATPKPESLLRQIVRIATSPGDLVLDSFAGSGTTGAVAHKMGRRWIMVEIGDHADTHIVPRMKQVIDGTDAGGVTEDTNWQGGGGYRYYRLATSLLEQDRYGNWVIAKAYNSAMLAEAMCKHLGFAYVPSAETYWQHGKSSETDFLYVTTQSLTAAAIARLAGDVGPERSLLVACKAWERGADAHDNLTLVKIPSAVLKRCEWGRDDYSLAVAALPNAPRTDLFGTDDDG